VLRGSSADATVTSSELEQSCRGRGQGSGVKQRDRGGGEYGTAELDGTSTPRAHGAPNQTKNTTGALAKVRGLKIKLK